MNVDQLRMFEPYTRTRPGDPETSHAAAQSLDEAHIRASQTAVLEHLREHGPMTDTELVRSYFREPRQSESGLRTRRSELTEGGLVVDTGRRVRLRSGRFSIVWGAAE